MRGFLLLVAACVASVAGQFCIAPVSPPHVNFTEPQDLQLHADGTYETVWYIGVVSSATRTFGVLFMMFLVADTCPLSLGGTMVAVADVQSTRFLQDLAIGVPTTTGTPFSVRTCARATFWSPRPFQPVCLSLSLSRRRQCLPLTTFVPASPHVSMKVLL